MASSPPLIALNGARLAFGSTTLFAGLSLTLAAGERACLVGRNGTGKSTLLKVIAGLQDLDGGERFLQPGTRVVVSYEEQNGQKIASHVLEAAVAVDEPHRVVEPHQLPKCVHKCGRVFGAQALCSHQHPR